MKEFDENMIQEETDLMSEEQKQALFEKIEDSAENIEIPTSLEPEAIKAKLKASKRKKLKKRYAEMAAAVALVAVIGGTGIYQKITSIPQTGEESFSQQAGILTGQKPSGSNLDNSDDDGASSSIGNGEVSPFGAKKLAVVGDYHLAKSYEELSSVVKKMRESYKQREDLIYTTDDEAANESDFAIKDFNTNSGAAVNGNMAAAGEKPDGAQSDGLEGVEENEYSTTNTQVEGVDESDYIKNDGKYLYIQTNKSIQVVDIQGEKMQTIATIEAKMEESDIIQDIYVDDHQLYLVLQKREEKEVGDRPVWPDYNGAMVDCLPYPYSFNVNTTMELQTFDITDKGNIKYLGAVTQDGTYMESRKVGNYIYLFSRKDCNPYNYIYRDLSLDDEEVLKDIIPTVNGKKVGCDCIYIQDNINNEYIVSSVNVLNPSQTVDHLVVMEDSYVQLHMGTDAFYLYETEYEWIETETNDDYVDGYSTEHTKITKFSYSNGHMNGVGAATVEGSINDTFAISEGNGILRVLTTEWRWDEEGSNNRLYLLDQNMKELSCLEGIARGEEIYAARVIGNVAYFITYHNTDPLFAVDISDPKNPYVLDEVEITGFSDYLHPFGDGLLLGIGYETDPETSARLGVKLVMFDISDPRKLEIKNTYVLNGTYSSATDFYKCAFADTREGLVGLDVSNWDEEYDTAYHLFSWEDGKFVEKMSEPLINCWNESYTRGMYANGKFFVIAYTEDGYTLSSFDMEKDYAKLDQIHIENKGW